MFMQWVIFMPLILPLALVSGAIEGVKRVFEQAASDIVDKEVVS